MRSACFHPPQHFGTVVVVLHGVFDEAEAVHVTNEGVAVGSEQVEAAHRLLKITHTDVAHGDERTDRKHTDREGGGQRKEYKQRY